MISLTTFIYNNAKLVITSIKLNLLPRAQNTLSWNRLSFDYSERSNCSSFSKWVDEIGSVLTLIVNEFVSVLTLIVYEFVSVLTLIVYEFVSVLTLIVIEIVSVLTLIVKCC